MPAWTVLCRHLSRPGTEHTATVQTARTPVTAP
jgi:hypothetical protein